jgi:hypothetical protein
MIANQWGARPLGVLWVAPRDSDLARELARTLEAFQCARVFREGAENCARGGRAPLSISEFQISNPPRNTVHFASVVSETIRPRAMRLRDSFNSPPVPISVSKSFTLRTGFSLMCVMTS